MTARLLIPRVGQRVRFVRGDWGDVGMEIPVGATGTVTKANGIRVELSIDEPWKKNASDTGGWSFYPECGPMLHPNGFEIDALEQFHHTCDYIR